MRMSTAVHLSLLLVLIVGCLVTEAARNRITVKTYKTNYRIDWWDDGRDYPYRVTYWKFGLKSVYLFGESGNLASLTVRGIEFTFPPGTDGSRMLLPSEEEEVAEDMPSGHRRLFPCSDCEETWDTLCDAGLADVCLLDEFPRDDFNEDAEDSVRRFCAAMGAACETPAFDTCQGQCIDAPTPAPTPAPTRGPLEDEGACDPNPCENGGSCTFDPAGGHTCSCASGYGGMACQIDTSSLDSFFIEIDFVGTWTDERRAVFQSAADRWSEVITHVPCGGNAVNPAGRLLITSTLEVIDGIGGTLGSAGANNVWVSCNTISLTGEMRFDIADVADLEADGIFEGVILHEMGHVIGVGTLWGNGYGECTTCRQTNDPTWKCPAALSVYADIGGSGDQIVELDGAIGTSCSHLDETIFDDELMTGFVDNPMFLSKMTAAVLDDLKYVVDPSAVDPYFLPSERGAALRPESGPASVVDTAVKTTILITDEKGNVVEEREGIMMHF